MTQKVTDEEFAVYVLPTTHENWASAHGNRYAESEAEHAEVVEWAQILRNSFNTGEFEITWR